MLSTRNHLVANLGSNMYTNIAQLMKDHGVTKFDTFRLSRKGNWVVSGQGSLISYSLGGGYDSGTVEFNSITAVYKNDGTGTLIEYTVKEDGGYDF